MQIKTPRPYLSWSQYNLFKSSPQGYVDAYVYGNKVDNDAMRKGRVVADVLEKDVPTSDEAIEQLRILTPTPKHREFEISTEVAGVPVFGKLDGFNDTTFVLDEFKTGKIPWSQNKVDKSGQITFYAMLIYQKFGKLPSNIRLHYLPTEVVMGMVKLTGEYFPYSTKRTISQVIDMAVDVKRIWEKIQKVATEEYKSIDKI